jgi:hypothetical protein
MAVNDGASGIAYDSFLEKLPFSFGPLYLKIDIQKELVPSFCFSFRSFSFEFS